MQVAFHGLLFLAFLLALARNPCNFMRPLCLGWLTTYFPSSEICTASPRCHVSSQAKIMQACMACAASSSTLIPLEVDPVKVDFLTIYSI